MNNEREAAIDIDEMLDRPLNKLTAAEFVQVLSHPKAQQVGSWIISDKKKYELWVEENQILRISVRELLDKLRGEKKKYELEPFIDIGTKVFPGGMAGQSESQYARLVEVIARQVEERMGRK